MTRNPKHPSREAWTDETENMYVFRFRPPITPTQAEQLAEMGDVILGAPLRMMSDKTQAVGFWKDSFGFNEAERQSARDEFRDRTLPNVIGDIAMIDGVAIQLPDLKTSV